MSIKTQSKLPLIKVTGIFMRGNGARRQLECTTRSVVSNDAIWLFIISIIITSPFRRVENYDIRKTDFLQ